jgi:hypothetical protein
MWEPEKTKPRKTMPAGVVGPEGRRLPMTIERTQLGSELGLDAVEMGHAGIFREWDCPERQ